MWKGVKTTPAESTCGYGHKDRQAQRRGSIWSGWKRAKRGVEAHAHKGAAPRKAGSLPPSSPQLIPTFLYTCSGCIWQYVSFSGCVSG